MNLEDVADELYALLPSEFTVARDDRARAARQDGDRELAGRIKALRKPTLGGWAANLLVRTAPEETDRFLALGEELRRAYDRLDGAQLRELARTQRQLIAALSRQARDAAAEAGHPIGDAAQREVEQTLQAVLADPEAAEEWSAGHLTKPLTPPTGFTTTDLRAVPGEPGEPRRAKAAEKQQPAPGRKREDRESRRGRQGKAQVSDLEQARERRRKREQEVDEARRAADEAAEEARRAADDRDTADEDLARAKGRRKAASDRLTAARDELRDAEREQQAAADAERDARDRAKEATRAAREADRAARRATDKADRLASRRTKR